MSVVVPFLLAITWSKPDVMFKFFKIQNLWQNAELGIIYFIWETVSERFIWHLNWPSRYTRHMMMGPSWALAKAILLKKPGIRLESREKLEVITAKPKCLQVRSKLATLKRSPAVSMWTWTGERYDRSRLALRVRSRIVKPSCSYMREVNVGEWLVDIIFLLFWYFWRVCETVDEWRML